MEKKIRLLVIALLLSALLAFPISSVSAQAVPNPDRIYYVTIGGPETADPAWAYDTASATLIFNVYETLCDFEFAHVERFVAEIADWWPGYGVNPGNTISPSPPHPDAPDYVVETWYFHIRDDIPWSDSDYGYVTPFDVEYSIERGMVMDHAGGPQWMFFEPLTGKMSSRQWNLSDPVEVAELGQMIDHAVESNDTHVWFNLVMPYAPFQQILSQSWGSVICAEWAMEHGCWNASWHVTPGDYTSWVDYNNPPEPGPIGFEMMGSGPYLLDYIDPDPHTGWYRLVYNPTYHGGWPGATAEDPTGPYHVTTAEMHIVEEWTDRKLLFLSEDPAAQADFCAVPRENAPEIEGEPGVRYIRDLPLLVMDALFFAYNMSADSPYVNYLGTEANTTLLRDRNLRLAFAHCINFTEYISDIFLGEAKHMHNPIVEGIRYFNETKLQMAYEFIDIDTIVGYLQAAWGGEVWEKGITVTITYNEGNTAREAVATTIETIMELLVPWPGTATVDIVPRGVPWSVYIPDLYSFNLGAFVIGWLADYPDPHNWVMPFMHTHGDFSYFQQIEYGLGEMNWHPDGEYGPLPYTNYAGEIVTEINNTYVDGLIETGITLPEGSLREELYNELMDIYYAECSQLPTVQARGRHYERDWVQGWFDNPIYPGFYYYDYWKQDPAEVSRDLAIFGYAIPESSWTVTLFIRNLGDVPEYVDVYAKFWVNDELVFDGAWKFWLEAGGYWKTTFTVPGTGELTYDIYVEISNWTPEITEATTGNNHLIPLPIIPSPWPTVFGDLGGPYMYSPKFFLYDGKVDGYDLALFIQCYKGRGPF